MQVTAKTNLFGIVGYPVSHSLSPKMHNQAFAALGLNYCYLPLPVSSRDLAQGIEGLRAFGFCGFNVTIPHKEAVIPLLDEVDHMALVMGAVNTVVNRAGKLIGYNTDGQGFLRSVAELWDYSARGEEIVILGAGGAARGIAAALASAGAAQVTLANRSRERAEKLCTEIQENFAGRFKVVDLAGRDLDSALANSSLVVQTSSVGMSPDVDAEPLIDPERLNRSNLVYDIIFNPLETRFLAGARLRGCRIANGMGMLLHQGAIAFELWTGQQAPLEVMRQALLLKDRGE